MYLFVNSKGFFIFFRCFLNIKTNIISYWNMNGQFNDTKISSIPAKMEEDTALLLDNQVFLKQIRVFY